MPVKSFRIDDLLNYDSNRSSVNTGDSRGKTHIPPSDHLSHNGDVSPSEPTDLSFNRNNTVDSSLSKRKSSSPVSQSEGKVTSLLLPTLPIKASPVVSSSTAYLHTFRCQFLWFVAS